MKSKFLVYFTALVFLTVVALATFSLINYDGKLIEQKDLNVKYEIGERAGFNVESENLNFGRLIPGSKSTRSISLHNEHTFPIEARIISSFNLKDIIIFNSSLQYIAPNDTIRMPITLYPSVDTLIGNYTGFIRIQIYSS